MNKTSYLSIITLLIFAGCTGTPSGPNADDFDRQAVLANWADNIIIPALTDFSEKAESLKVSALTFRDNPTQENLLSFRNSWKTGYLAWQHVSMFETPETMALRYRNNMNIFPVDTAALHENIRTGQYNLELPSEIDQQGFPALDYLLFGLGDNDAEILSYYTEGELAASYLNYAHDLAIRMDSLTDRVLGNWTNGYRDEFISNTGNGATASLDMMVNDYIYYFEKIVRAGKIGIPAGVFSGNTLSQNVEGYYSRKFSKELFMESLNAAQSFFNGDHFGSQQSGVSLSDYLEYLNSIKNGADLTSLINQQFETARLQAGNLSQDLVTQVETNNTEMLRTYDELQKNVILMKVDMLQALNINIDYVDADGD